MEIKIAQDFYLASRKDYAGGECTFELMVADNRQIHGQFIFTAKNPTEALQMRSDINFGKVYEIIIKEKE